MADEGSREVEKQARVGNYNRLVARCIEDGENYFLPPWSPLGSVGEFFCTCGRPDCDEVIVMTLEEHRFVRERPYRFVVAPGHATEADELIRSTGDYEVVEVKPEYRDLARDIIEAA